MTKNQKQNIEVMKHVRLPLYYPFFSLQGRVSKSPYGGVGTYPPTRASSRANNHQSTEDQSVVNSTTSRMVATGGATLSRLHMMQQQGPQAQEAIKRQTMSARGLSGSF